MSESAPRAGAFVTLAVSGAVGYYVGARGFPEWQVPVETAQVIAGIVRYPPGNPFFIYHLKLWTMLHQVCATLLATGVSEIRLSTILSGVTGMVSFQALAMTTYAFSRSAWLSIVAAVAIFMGRAAEYGVRYPIFLLGTSHTYGSIGLSWIVLVAALIGCGRYGLGLFLLGMAPALHPSLGVWLALIAGLSFACQPQMARAWVLPRWRWFAAGALVSAASLAVHLWTSRHVPPIDAATASRYLAAFTQLWDEHRQPMGFGHAGMVLNIAAMLVGLIWLTFFRSTLPASSTFVLTFVAVSAAVSLACAAISFVPPDRLPRLLIMLMPTRVVNVDAMMFGAMIVGLAGAVRDRVWARLLVTAVIAGLLLNHRDLLSTRSVQTTWLAMEPRMLTLAVLLGGAGLLMAGASFDRWRRPRQGGAPHWLAIVADVATILVVATAVIPSVLHVPPRTETATFRDRTNDGLFATAARTKGMLLTGGDLHLAQLRSRRPVLIDGGGLDGLPYAVAGAPETERILRDVYGIDFFHPPSEAHGTGMIPTAFNRKIWEDYTTARWKDIRRAYNVTQVLTYNDWTLRLPIVAQSGSYLLYEIPE
jgi:hypothetical protein